MTTPARPGPTGAGHLPIDVLLNVIAANTRDTADALTKMMTMARLGGSSAAASGNIPGMSGPSAGASGAGAGSGGYAAKATQEFQERQRKTMEWASGFNQVGLGNTGSGMSHMSSVAGGMKKLGIPGSMAMARAAPFAGAVIGAVNTAAGVSRVMHDAYSTGDMKTRALARMLPGGETLQGWHDSFTGRAAGMEQAGIEGRIRGIGVRGGLETSSFLASHNPGQAGYAAAAAAYRGGSAVTAGVFDRGTAGGRTAYEDAQRMLPYRQATAKAERDLAASSATRLASQKELNRLEAKENELTATKAKLNKDLAAGGSGVDYQELIEKHKNVTDELLGVNQQRRQASQGLAGAGRDEAGARGELTKARIRESLLGKADNLGARADRSEASAGRLGSMDPFQRSLGLQAIKMLEAGANPDLMPAELKSAARQLDPDSFDQLTKQHGLGTAEFKDRQSNGKRGFEGNYVSLRSQQDALIEQAGKEEYGADTKAAGEIAKAGANLGADFARMSRQYTDAAMDAFRKEILSGKNHQ